MKQQFDKYLAGKISEEEREQLTAQLLSKKFNEELRQKVAEQLAKEQGIVRNPRFRLRKLRWPLSIAAAVLLVLVCWTLLMPRSPAYLTLADSYLSIPQANTAVRKGAEDHLSELEAAATTAYNSQNFVEAAKSYEQLRRRLPAPSLQLRYYLGLSYLYQEPAAIEKAVPLLRTVVDGEDLRLADEADWYLSLALIKAQEFDEAKRRLQKRAQESGWQTDKANQLLSVLP